MSHSASYNIKPNNTRGVIIYIFIRAVPDIRIRTIQCGSLADIIITSTPICVSEKKNKIIFLS